MSILQLILMFWRRIVSVSYTHLAAGNISLKSVGDISVGQISTSGDVTIDSAGNIYDAIDRSDRDERSAQKRLESWIEAGILTSDGTSNEGARLSLIHIS